MPHPLADTVQRLVVALRKHLVERDIDDVALSAERQAIVESWTALYPTVPAATPLRLAACRYLDATIAAGRDGPCAALVSEIAGLTEALNWRYGYAPHPDWPGLDDRIAFAPIIGGQGVLNDDKARLGLTLLAPHTHYPLHAHPAIETYLVLAGTAEWRLGGKPFERQAPGALILHESGMGHAMQTDADPMLALYVWRGDLLTAPLYVDD